MPSLLRSRPATTLIEILLYFVLLAIILLAVMSFALQLGELYGMSSNRNEVQYSSHFVHEQLSNKILKAVGVDDANTLTGVDEGSIGLLMEEAASSPAVFYLQSGVLYLKEGLGAPEALTPSYVQVDFFRVTEVELEKAPTQFQVDLQLSILNANREAMEATLPLHWTFTLRTL